MANSTPAPAQRLLSRAQMAFVRCWAEGLDLQAAAARYLLVDGSADARRARAELRRLRDDLCHLARAHGRPDVAALLRRDPQAIADRGPVLPTLEEFRAGQPSDFYSEAELAALYREEYGAPDARGPERRRQRLRERLVLALQWLERVGVREPVPGDPIAAWLDGRIAARLAAAGLHTLGDLVERIVHRGTRWHDGIPRVGAQSAARLQRWLGDHEDSLGSLAPAATDDAPPGAPQAGIVPLERFAPPAGLDGSSGSNRAPAGSCRIDAANDLAAVHVWLALRSTQPHTWRAYRREAERILVWAVTERGKPLSSLDAEDCAAFLRFLVSPDARWTAPRSTPRASAGWRPFEGPLSVRSVRSASAIVRALFAWLVRQRYLAVNPWDDLPARPAPAAEAARRALAPSHWAEVERWLAARPPSPAQRRLGLLLRFGHETGLRLSELAAAKLGWLQAAPGDGGTRAWTVRVPGFGDRARELPLSARTVDDLGQVLADRGLANDPRVADENRPLFARLSGESGLSTARLHQLLVGAFRRCASDLAGRDPAGAAHIARASAQWLRQGHGLGAAGRGMPIGVLRSRLGHRSLATTAGYLAGGG